MTQQRGKAVNVWRRYSRRQFVIHVAVGPILDGSLYMKTIKGLNNKVSVNKIFKTAKCLTIFGILVGTYSSKTLFQFETVRAPSSLSLATVNSNLCSKVFQGALGTSPMSLSKGRFIPTMSQVRFGTGNGSLMTNSTMTVKLKNGQTMTAFVDRQQKKSEDDAWLFITDGHANQVIHKIELESESLKISTTMMTSRGPLFVMVGESYVSPRNVTNLHVVDPQSGKLQLIELDGFVTGGDVLFPKSPGEAILVYEGKSTFATYDPLFGKKTGTWDLEGLKSDEKEGHFFLQRIPGDSERIVLSSDKQFVVINLTTKTTEWEGRNNFGRHAGIVETSQGPILYGMGVYADAKLNRMTLRLFNLKTREQYSIDLGDSNTIIGSITEVNINGRSYLTATVQNTKGESSLKLLDIPSGKPIWSVDLPTKGQQVTVVPIEGQMPLLLVSPYLADVQRNGSHLVLPANTFKISDATKDHGNNVVPLKPKQTKQETESSPAKSNELESQTKDEPRNGTSWGYLISTSGERVATLEYEGGIRNTPHFYQQGRSLIVKYQSSYHSTLGTLVVPLKDK